ncbi:hypothetical protein AFLA_006494 [Aspergillus flavus NRRL3357]|nr:hypothetical protein AFLA_006494 [Aspergillus flavus NRRL3357]
MHRVIFAQFTVQTTLVRQMSHFRAIIGPTTHCVAKQKLRWATWMPDPTDPDSGPSTDSRVAAYEDSKGPLTLRLGLKFFIFSPDTVAPTFCYCCTILSADAIAVQAGVGNVSGFDPSAATLSLCPRE